MSLRWELLSGPWTRVNWSRKIINCLLRQLNRKRNWNKNKINLKISCYVIVISCPSYFYYQIIIHGKLYFTLWLMIYYALALFHILTFLNTCLWLNTELVSLAAPTQVNELACQNFNSLLHNSPRIIFFYNLKR